MDSDQLLRAVADRLRTRTDDLVDRQLVELRRFPSYDRVPDDDLVRSCRRNVARVLATLEQHDGLPPYVEEDERASGQRRALQGVPSEEVVGAYRTVLAVLRDAFIEEAGAAGADPGSVLAGTRRLWDLTDRYSDVLVSARQQVDIDAARRDERSRMALLQRLLAGGVAAGELVEGGAVHGVLPERDYWVVRCRPRPGGMHQLTRHLEARGPGRPLVVPLDEDVAGIVAARPDPHDGAVIAVAGPVPLSDVPRAFDEATRVLTVALRYGWAGVVDRSSLSVRLAVEQQAELGELLYRRYVAGLRSSRAGRELLGTVREHLRLRRSVKATAEALSVHENTVRYRLERYAELTGADLAETDALVEVWWALEWAALRDGDAGEGQDSH
jgi:PucR C-terminal helix-turn-helix domain